MDKRKQITIYGIRNCDTMKKARAWLDARGIAHAFHDYRVQGVSEAMLRRWSGEAGWEVLLNRAGATFRALPEGSRVGLDEANAIALMLKAPAMIKRPVLEAGAGLIVGFKPEIYAARLESCA